jgi:hypothetical protein
MNAARILAALASCALTAALAAAPAAAHDQWADGSPVPAWVKSACCGPSDAHMLAFDDVSLEDDGWHIRGINTIVPRDRVLPSQDGQIWGFWNPALGPDVTIYCFFAPMEF